MNERLIMPQKKVSPRKRVIKDCESCIHREGDFWKDMVNPNIIRAFCKALFFSVDVSLMGTDCEHFALDPSRENKEEKKNPYGL